MFKTWSFKSKLQGVIGLLGIVSILSSGYLTYSVYNGGISIKSHLVKGSAESIIDKIDRNLFERYGDVQAFALSESARSGDPERITKFMSDMMSAYSPIYDAMLVLDKKGNVIAANKVDKKGQTLNNSALLNKNFADEEWFKACVQNKIQPGQAYHSDLRIDKDIATFASTDGKVLTFSSPIRDSATGEVLGVWTNQMSWNDVVQEMIISESKKLVDERITAVYPKLLDSTGTYLYHHDATKILAAKDDSIPDFLAKNIDRVTEIKDENEKINASSMKAYSKEKGFSVYPGKGWILTLEAPTNDKFIQLAVYTSMAGILVLILLAGLSALVAQSTSGVLEKITNRLENESTKVSETASDVTSAAHSLSESSTEQASALQETAASIEEINAMIKKSNENSNRSREVAHNSANIAKKGQESVDDMSKAINEINISNEAILKQIVESNNQISDIARVISEIGNKTKVINDIVFQTKLLSFNASVEAARAGEHGKGFAVVAEEVGNLAQMSGNAAKEISEMLNESIKNVESTVSESKRKVESLISDGRQKLKAGIEIADQCGEILKEVVVNVDDLAVMVSEISVASQEQSQGVNEITKAMNELDQSTHSNATTSQKVSGNAGSLSEQAEHMNEIVSELLNVVVGGKGNRTHAAPSVKAKVQDKAPVPEKPKQKDASVSPIRLVKNSTSDIPTSDDPRFKEV